MNTVLGSWSRILKLRQCRLVVCGSVEVANASKPRDTPEARSPSPAGGRAVGGFPVPDSFSSVACLRSGTAGAVQHVPPSPPP